MAQQTVFGELNLTLDDADLKALRVDLTGRSNNREPGRELVPYFNALLHRVATNDGAMEVHFEKLEHFNSSTISALIQIINIAHSEKVRLKVIYDGGLRWQALSFDALRRALKPFETGETGSVVFVPRP